LVQGGATVSDVVGEGGAYIANATLWGDMVKAGMSLDDTVARLREVLGRPLTDEERAELEAARAKADELAAEHGPDHHGFGNPPSKA
jgi:hypothetical protein